jgi:hypothetical protein
MGRISEIKGDPAFAVVRLHVDVNVSHNYVKLFFLWW